MFKAAAVKRRAGALVCRALSFDHMAPASPAPYMRPGRAEAKELTEMRNIILIGAAGVFLSFAVAGGAMAMGGQGGPLDGFASPYALYYPQSIKPPPGWGPLEGRSVYEGQGGRVDCRGDRACERRMERGVPNAPAPQ